MLPELSSGKMKTLASPLTADPGALRRDLGDHGGNHQIGEDTRQPRRLKGLRLGHSPRAAALVESLRVRLKLPASRGIEERGAPERDAQSPQPRLDFVNVP